MIRAYASRTGTQRNLDGLRAHGWGLLISAYGEHRNEGWTDIMLDPGTWSTRASGGWDANRFVDLLDAFGHTSEQTIAPDIVAGGRASLDLSLAWLDDLLALGRPVLLAAQDGLNLDDVRPHLSERVGVAVGGSTGWKWRTASSWARLAKECGARCHVLRANSERMIAHASAIGADSFDGSGPSVFADCLERYDRGRTRPATMLLPLDLPTRFKPREPRR